MSQESFYANLAKWEYVSLGVKGDKVQELVEAGHIKMDGSGPDRLFVNIPIACACQRKPAARHHARAPPPVVLLPPAAPCLTRARNPGADSPFGPAVSQHFRIRCCGSIYERLSIRILRPKTRVSKSTRRS